MRDDPLVRREAVFRHGAEFAMYRVGRPGWRMLARLGVSLRLRVQIRHDPEANVYVAESPDLEGLVVEARTLDEVQEETLAAAAALLELQLKTKAKAHTDFIWHSTVPA